MINQNLRAVADATRRKDFFLSIDTTRISMLEKLLKFLSDQISEYYISEKYRITISVIHSKDLTPSSLKIDVKGHFTKKEIELIMSNVKHYVLFVSRNKLYLLRSENNKSLIFSILDDNVLNKFSLEYITYKDFLKIQKVYKNIATLETPTTEENKWIVNQKKVIKPFLKALEIDLEKNLKPLRHLISFSMKCSIEHGAVIITAKYDDIIKIKELLSKSFSNFEYKIDETNQDPKTILVKGKLFKDDEKIFEKTVITPKDDISKKIFSYMGKNVEIFKAVKIISKNILTGKDYKQMKDLVIKNKNSFLILLNIKLSNESKLYDITKDDISIFFGRQINIFRAEKIEAHNFIYELLKKEEFVFFKDLTGQYWSLEKDKIDNIKIV